MRTTLAASLLLLSLLAGCSGDKDGDGGPTHDDLSVPGSTTVLYLNMTVGNETFRFSSTDAPANATHHASTGTTTVASAPSTTGNSTAAKGNATKGNATGNLTQPGGNLPLNVSLTLGAKGLPAGKAITWTVGFGDGRAGPGNATGSSGNKTAGNSSATPDANGTKLPAMANHTYTAPGTHAIVFVVRQGSTALATLRTGIIVSNGTGTPSGPVPGTSLGQATIHEDGVILFGGTEADCDQIGSVDILWSINATVDGAPVSVSHLLVHLTGSLTAADLDVVVLTPDGDSLGNTDGDAGDSDETVDAAGPFPPGDYTVHIAACAALNGSYTVEGTADLVVA